ncbi:MAG: ATP-binding protein [Planctomycetota bacterium]|nr:ATP-binding protein [Planctomycetota bacterium]
MNLPTRVVELLGERLAADLAKAESGHCMRLDHMSLEDCLAVCRATTARLQEGSVAFVVTPDATPNDASRVRPERAIEIRNRKQSRLCIFVPAGTRDAAASSLSNSFATFDLTAFLRDVRDGLLRGMPPSLATLAKQAIAAMPKGPGSALESVVEYLGVLVGDPTPERAGIELWRLGLIPDSGGESFLERLPDNKRCSQTLTRPPRAQMSLGERLGLLGLRAGSLREELETFLESRRLRDARTWLMPLAEADTLPRLSFSSWAFEKAEASDLESIDIVPLLDSEGVVKKETHLSQPNGQGTPPTASVGPKAKVTIHWDSQPKTPVNLKRWRVELVPSGEEYSPEEVAGVELPSTTVPAKSRKASVKLDIDLGTCPVKVVQARVVGLDEFGAELRRKADETGDPKIVQGISTEFWLDREEVPEVESKKRLETVPNIPLGRLRAAMDISAEAIEQSPGQWTERDIHFFSVTLNGRRVLRVGLSPVLRQIETRIIEEPDSFGSFCVTADSAHQLDPGALRPSGDAELLRTTPAGEKFLEKRRSFLKLLRDQGPAGLIETCDWSEEMSRRARVYASAYRDLLEAADTPGLRRAAFGIDTVRAEILHARDHEPAALVAPTHPLRALWYAAYNDLLRDWDRKLLATPKPQRKSIIDLSVIERVAPLNCPAFLPDGSSSTLLFAQNLRFFWGLAFPANARDPSRRVADIARIVGLDEDESSIADLPPIRLASELRAYSGVHPYLRTLRLNLLNPGSGAFVAEGLRSFYGRDEGDDETEDRPPTGVDILAHFHEPLPVTMGLIAQLQTDLYESQPPGKRHHLTPFFSLTIRSMDQSAAPPGGDVNLTVAVDHLTPKLDLVPADPVDDSSSFYGLLVRLLPDFEAGSFGARWTHRLNFPPDASRQRHPVLGLYTNELCDTHVSMLACLSGLLESGPDIGRVPAVVAELAAPDRERLNRIHTLSDWVITLDRFFGVEYYDNPQVPGAEDISRRYLLDYAPEFLEGLGHRMLVTTGHREEIEEVLGRAMAELGFGLVQDSVGDVLQHLKTISGRLALRVIGDQGRAREAVSLGVVAAYLRAKGTLDDSVLVPVDAHPELFAPMRARAKTTPQERCDLIRIQFKRGRLAATFIEVKSRVTAGSSEELFNRIADQIESTEARFRELFFQRDPERLDHVLQRSRLNSLLRFYLRRAQRYGLITSDEKFLEMQAAVAKLETGVPELSVERNAYIVSLNDKPKRPLIHNGVRIEFLTAADFAELNLAPSPAPPSPPRAPTAAEPGGDGSERREPLVAIPAKDAPPATPSDNISPTPAPQPHQRSASEGQGEAPTISARKGESTRVVLGHTQAEETPVAWTPSVQSSPHLFILGIPGQGKSVTVNRILQEFAKEGLPSVVIDFHGAFADTCNPYVRSANPVVLDATKGLPFSPFEADLSKSGAEAASWQTNCFAIAEIFAYVCELGDMQKDVVFDALRSCYQDLGYGSGTPDRLPTISDFHRKLSLLELSRGVRNVVARCRPLLELGLFREDPSTFVPLDQLLARGLVLDVHRAGVETMQVAAGAFLLRQIYKSMFNWEKAASLRLAIVLDEAHRLAKDTTLPKIMKEGRKFGISVVVASQGLADFHPDVVENAGTKVVFRTNHPMSKKVSGFLRTRTGQDLVPAIEQLPVGVAFVQTPEMPSAARVAMAMPED